MINAIDICEEKVVCSSSGSYKRKNLTYENSNVLNINLHNKYRNVWDSQAFYPELSLYKLCNIRMEDLGYLFYGEKLIEESVLHLNDKDLIENRYSISSNTSENIEAESLLLKRRSSSNFGHWLIEFLPWASIAKSQGIEFQQVILEYFSKNAISNVQEKTLSAYGVNVGSIQRCKRTTYHIDNVWVPSKGAIHNHTKHPFLVDRARINGFLLASHFSNNEIDLGERIYIARKGEEKRGIINEALVNEKLKDFGFVKIYPSDYPFELQVKIFSNAKVVVGVSGAAMTNIIFCKNETKVICLQSNLAFENFFWDLACHCDLEFSYVFGKASGENPHSSFSIDKSNLDEVLKINCG